jgi:hypothetical protein
LDRPPGIYASSLSRRDLARRRARMRSSFLPRAGSLTRAAVVIGLAIVIAERLA